MVTGVLDKVRVFTIKCGCSGVVEGVLGVGAGVLVTVRVFWSGCICSRQSVVFLEWERVF